MTLATRAILILALILSLAAGLSAQETTATAETATAPPAASVTGPASQPHNSRAVRDDFSALLRGNAPELARLLALDPGLLGNEEFLAGYPDIATFVAAHPEMKKSPGFYLAQFSSPRRSDPLEKIFEPLIILATIGFIAFAISWLIRAVIEQRRWSRLSRTQTEVHTRILDRFGSSEELLAYMKTPAGTRFLESAPIPLGSGSSSPGAPIARILWSIQLGVVVVAGAIGLLIVANQFDRETAQGLFAMGTIVFCVGAGFIASAGVSIFLSKKLGLWQSPPTLPGDGTTDPDLVR